ncbi:MAG: helix-hairpin-helix domain-containing protein [Sediminibacterium sp.]
MKKIIKDYLTFSKKERTAIILLLLLIACFIAAPYLYSPKPKPPLINKALVEFLAKNKSASAESSEEDIRSFHPAPEIKAIVKKESFFFDPNTVSPDEWKRLGIADKTIRTILNYKNKGGKFRSAEDLRKIWGLKKEDANRLIPFVRMPETESLQYKSVKKELINTELITHTKFSVLDVNTATAEEWKALPGIGEVLANRIIKFRDRIGGFTSLEQVRKTYGISDSVFQVIGPYLKLNSATVQKINLNIVSAYDLRVKANIPDVVAKAIVIYRQQYGPYQSVNDLKKVVLMSDSLFLRVSPYFSTQ